MAHNRKLVLSGIALTTARISAKQNGTALNLIRDEIEQEMVQSGYLENAPFKWVGLIIRYGLVNDIEPHYQKINAKYGDLPLAIEIDVHRLLGVTEPEMVSVYRKAILIALSHAGDKYHLNTKRIKQMLVELGS
jgi:hypothetical protein